MQLNNNVIISAAGSGKTSYIVKEALEQNEKNILILTYTLDNLKEIKKKIIKEIGAIPSNIKVRSWFSFLITDCARPYQNYLYNKKRIESIFFVQGKSTQYVRKENISKYYFKNGKYLYTDKISEFICLCNRKSGGLVVDRLENMYDYIYIDEVQDLAGYDFDLLDLFFSSKINMVLVGDNRQATYFTNNSPKYKKYKGKNIIDLFKDWEQGDKCNITYRYKCYRCNQYICDLADSLYPGMKKTNSDNHEMTGHDGLFYVEERNLDKYINKYNPQILRFNRRTKLSNFDMLNFGESKGLTFDRVLIIPNGKIKQYLKTGNINHVEKSRAKFYVAITRARYSVAFLYNGKVKVDSIKKYIFD